MCIVINARLYCYNYACLHACTCYLYQCSCIHAFCVSIMSCRYRHSNLICLLGYSEDPPSLIHIWQIRHSMCVFTNISLWMTMINCIICTSLIIIWCICCIVYMHCSPSVHLAGIREHIFYEHGTACGLSYLHHHNPQFIHQCLKS